MSFKSIKSGLFDTKPRVCFLVQTGFGTSFSYLTSGVFLSGLAIFMGAGDVLVSYISVILNMCGVLLIAFSAILGRFHSRKRLTILLTIISRILTVFIVAIPIILPSQMQLPIFITIVILAFTFQAQTTVALNQWMLYFIDGNKKGQYISLRQTITLFINVILALVGGYFMDYMGGEYFGFLLLFTAAALMGLCEIITLVKTPNHEVEEIPTSKVRIRDIFILPLKNKKFMSFMLYIFLLYLLLYIGDSYTMVYMMRYLSLPYQTVTLLYMIISLPQIIILAVCGKICDKHGANFVLKTSIFIFASETLFIFFAGPDVWFVFIPIAFFLAAIANAGFSVAVFNRRYELMPAENRIVYDNFYTAIVGLAFVFGPLIGGAFSNLFEINSQVANIIPFGNIRFLYLISTLGLLLLQIVCMIIDRVNKKKQQKFSD